MMSRAQVKQEPASANSGFLKRGQNSAVEDLTDDSLNMGNSPVPLQLAAGRSAFDGEEAADGLSTVASSQLFSQAPGVRLVRQRPRFHTVQDLDLALNQAIEGRINSKNAWASKEASDLLEGITHTIESTLDTNTADDYTGFTKAATVVEGCSKVWTVRVDSTYLQSNQMLQRLLRNEEGPTAGTADGNGDTGDGDGDDDETRRNRRRNQRVAAAAAAAAAARTLALNASEINLDRKARTALTQTGINAQFRAITEKFDQGNAQGLLLSNAPLGGLGNVILDVDYARVEGQFSAKKAHQARQRQEEAAALAAMDAEDEEEEQAGRRWRSGARGTGVKAEPTAENGPGAVATVATAPVSVSGRTSATTDGSPRHSLLCVEHDMHVDMTLDDLPDLTPAIIDGETGLLQPPSAAAAVLEASGSHRGSRLTVGPASSGTSSARVSSGVIDNLLVLPHAAMKQELLTEAGGSRRGSLERPSASSSRHDRNAAGGAAAEAEGQEEGLFPRHDDYDDTADDDFSGGGGDWDDDYDEGLRGSGGPSHDVGQEARQLVSGISEMEAVEAYFENRRGGGAGEATLTGEEETEYNPTSLLAGAQLALEAEDPSAWCPLTDASTNPFLGAAPNSELSRLRKRHHLVPTQQQQRAGGSLSGSSVSGTALAATGAGADGQPPVKRGRKEKTVVFDLTEVVGLGTGASGAAATTALLHMSKSDRDSGALKQSTTATKNATALGKEILLGKDATHAVLAYTQSAVQRAKAEQARLVLPADPVPGETIPSYLAFPITIDGFFQPFSTTQLSWNMLRKSASGRLIDSQESRARHSLNSKNGTAHGLRGGEVGGEDTANDNAAMPVAFFAGGAETDNIDGGEYDEANDFYYGGAEDDDDGVNEEEEAYRRAELQLLHQFDAQQQQQQQQQLLGHGTTAMTAADMASAISSAIASARNSGQLVSRMDPQELVRVLQSPEAVLPTQVDVVKLRATMWLVLQELAGIATHEKDAEGVRHRKHQQQMAEEGESHSDAEEEEEEGEEKEDEERTPGPIREESMLKPGLLQFLAKRTKGKRTANKADVEKGSGRKRAQEREEDERSSSDGSEEDEEDAATPRPHSKKASHRTLKDGNSETDSSDASGESDMDEDERLLGNYAKGGNLTFSDVVEALLPQVPLISSTGTLSPAFFFFSVLFLANEHSIVLKNVKTLDDLVIDEKSLTEVGGGVIERRSSPKRQKTTKGQTATRA